MCCAVKIRILSLRYIFYFIFQGKRVYLTLRALSSFAEEMAVESVTTVPPDPRFYFKEASDKAKEKGAGKLVPGQKSYLGKVVFDPAAACSEDDSCYVGFSASGKTGKEWLHGLSLPPSLAETDPALAVSLRRRGLEALQPSSVFNVTLNLDTSKVRGFRFSARAALVWPRVVKFNQPPLPPGTTSSAAAASTKEGSDGEEGEDDASEESSSAALLFHFPLTQVGNSSFRDLLLSNPSPQRPLLVHLVPMAAYPSGAKAAAALAEREGDSSSSDSSSSSPAASSSSRYTASLPPDTFRVHSVVDSEDKSPFKTFSEDPSSEDPPSSSSPPSSSEAEALTKAFVLPAGRTARVRLRFRPPSGPAAAAGEFRSALFVRNNLTGVEAVDLAGRSVFGSLSFGGWKSSGGEGGTGSAVLRFEVQEKHLKDCNRELD